MTQLGLVLRDSLMGLWQSMLDSVPRILGAVIVFLLGLVLASVLRHIVVRLVKLLRIDDMADKFELKKACEKYGVCLNISAAFGWIVKWFFVVVALVASTEILGWSQVTDVLKKVVLFVPNVIIAVIILLAGILLGNFVRTIVKSAVEAAHLSSAAFLAGLAKWAIFVFSLMAALVQLDIAPRLIETLFMGFVGMLSLAGGLAFGLGGKDHASRFLDRLRNDISSEK